MIGTPDFENCMSPAIAKIVRAVYTRCLSRILQLGFSPEALEHACYNMVRTKVRPKSFVDIIVTATEMLEREVTN